jgi:hypothetical protein
VAGSIPPPARAVLEEVGRGWFERRRGHVRLFGPGLRVEADVEPVVLTPPGPPALTTAVSREVAAAYLVQTSAAGGTGAPTVRALAADTGCSVGGVSDALRGVAQRRALGAGPLGSARSSGCGSVGGAGRPRRPRTGRPLRALGGCPAHGRTALRCGAGRRPSAVGGHAATVTVAPTRLAIVRTFDLRHDQGRSVAHPVFAVLDAVDAAAVPERTLIGGLAVMCRLTQPHPPTRDVDTLVRFAEVSGRDLLLAVAAQVTSTGVVLGATPAARRRTAGALVRRSPKPPRMYIMSSWLGRPTGPSGSPVGRPAAVTVRPGELRPGA